ncbi:MAG TPA: hypothetical protein VMU77_02310, partial [Acidimicrobiales bacterium]|nr:hypothetical protein [Acidimicrobiales bacterium]
VCCDANFGMLPRDIEIIEKVIASRHSTGYPYTISVQNAKNSTERSYKIQKLLSDNMHTTGVTLSLQTTNQNTLKNIRRANIRSESFRELQRRFARDGIYTYTDVIIGLPGETYVEFADSIAQVIADGQHNHIQFHNCSILPNAEMGDPEYIKKFGMVTAPLPIRAVYAPADEEPEYEEFLDTVVATDAMPPQQWVQAKTFAWMTDLLYFDRLLQIPLLVTHERLGVSHRLLMESITEADEEQFPTLGWARSLLRTQAALIQDGTLEFFKGSSGGNLLWPGDQYLYIEMVSERRLDQFYQEAEKSLMEFTKLASDPLEESIIIQEAFSLNKALLCLPDQDRDVSVVLSHDILSYWRGVSEGETPELTETMASYRINRAARTWSSIEDWAEFLIWCQGRDKREYLYEITQSRRALAS